MKNKIKKHLKSLPVIGTVIFYIYKTLQRIGNTLEKIGFPGSIKYWENRYSNRGTSGSGSYGKLAIFKADVINSFIKEKKIKSLLELGCDDGNQLALFRVSKYIGLDVSGMAIKLCINKFKEDNTKSFFIQSLLL